MTSRQGLTTRVSGLKWMVEDQVEAMENVLEYAGERAVAEARSKTKANDWKDRTGNLRSSIGYVVLRDGKPIAGSAGDGTEGAAQAASLLDRLSGDYRHGLALIVVAGMQYASYVESRGYNVVGSAQDLAEEIVTKMLDQL